MGTADHFSSLAGVRRVDWTDEEGVKVGSPPNAQALLDIPIFFLAMINFSVFGGLLTFLSDGDAELLFETKKETSVVRFTGVEVSAGTTPLSARRRIERMKDRTRRRLSYSL